MPLMQWRVEASPSILSVHVLCFLRETLLRKEKQRFSRDDTFCSVTLINNQNAPFNVQDKNTKGMRSRI